MRTATDSVSKSLEDAPSSAPPRSSAAPSLSSARPSSPGASVETNAPIVLFDGVCNLCNGAVQFIIDHERAPNLRFAALQSEIAERLLTDVFGEERSKELRTTATSGDPDSVVLIEGSRGYTHSTAGLRLARHLRAPWRWLYAFIIVPAVVRDAVYRLIARNRYRWFGKAAACRVPTPELRARFL